MLKGPTTKVVASLLALALLGAACTSRDDDDDSATGDDTETDTEGAAAAGASIDVSDCVTDPTEEVGDEIKLVSSFPQSGLVAAFSEIARGWKAYFDKVNAEGGANFAGKTVTIEYEDKDDEYNPAETVANINELVGPDGDQAFATFSVVGTANNVAIRDELDELCVPDVFAGTGSPAWGDPAYPWLIGSTLAPYSLEANTFVDMLEQEKPDATVAMLVQDDDFGAGYEESFRQAIEGTDIELVEVQKYAPADAGSGEVSAQMTALAATNADAFFDGATLIACPTALTKAAEAGWEPITYVSATCTSNTLMGLAGEAANGVYSVTNLKDPRDPQWDDDEAMEEYVATVQEYQPVHNGADFDPQNTIPAYGYTQAAVFVEALAAAEEPTRLGLMEAIRNLDGVSGGLLLPGMTVATNAEDPFMGETLQLVQYDYLGEGERNHFVAVGDVTDFEGQSAELTPEHLITG